LSKVRHTSNPFKKTLTFGAESAFTDQPGLLTTTACKLVLRLNQESQGFQQILMRSMDVFQTLLVNQRIDNAVKLFSVLDTLVLRLVEIEINKLVQDDEDQVSRFLQQITPKYSRELDVQKNARLNFEYSVKEGSDGIPRFEEMKEKLNRILVRVDIDHGSFNILCVSLRFCVMPESHSVEQENL
jgi:hypothetical protein